MFLTVSGCSIAFVSTLQTIYVTTPNALHAYCTLETDKQKYQVITPAKIKVERSKYDMLITCHKDGYRTTYKNIQSTASAKAFWTGLDHYMPSINVDSLSRTVYSYPEVISILLSPDN